MSQDIENPNNDPLLLDHEYDGIRELDYPLPAWWLGTFFITIIFGALYWFHYDLSEAGLTSDQELALEMNEIQKLKDQAEASAPKLTNDQFVALIGDSAALDQGRAEFQSKCAACHGNEGQGLIGPNLTDNHWKNSDGSLAGVHEIVVNGVVEKGMPPWKGLIADDLLMKVTAYIGSLKGSNPANAKEAEGTLYE